jgi:4-amino-4-deoxy-L-arabinose transferase-like glycosyltransferase
MNYLTDKKVGVYCQIGLVLLALLFLLLNLNKYPLLDYDEATYAKVTMDTLNSGQMVSLKYNTDNWFEKPPLYFWLGMGSVKVFGENEFAFRLPSALLGIVALWLVWLIAKKLTANNLIASGAFLILLFSPPFNYFSREMRMDSGVIMSILLALYAVISGWTKKTWLLWILPAVAIGFLFKSFIAFLAFPIILIFCLFYKQWLWLKNKFFWLGAIIVAVIIIPWHLAMHLKYGQLFWQDYLARQIFERATVGISAVAKLDYFSHIKMLWQFNEPWTVITLLLLVILVVVKFKKSSKLSIQSWPIILSVLFSTFLVLMIFTVSQTHIFTYILPAYPFLAIFIAVILYDFYYNYVKFRISLMLIFSALIIWGALNCLGITGGMINEIVKPFHYEQKAAALAFKEKNSNHSPLYLLDWLYPEAIRYYGRTQTKKLSLETDGGQTVKGPVYILTNIITLNNFFGPNGQISPEYQNIEVPYGGKYLILLYSGKDVVLPKVR